MKEGEERFSGFVIVCSNTSELLQLIKHPLNTITIFVVLEIIRNMLFSIGTRRDNRKNASKE
ncbi:hypothetical protein A265_01799 (plasmid) [Zymomonas mobilis subsp. mobilis str. CP4 = NRRL B-14023]|nr:hypothetical protein A254_01799 [Zymomonas mobilis subsp. mobilis NRRL B-12526]AHJ73236.1 hypothetical protein A265_01799 [Zymomonas mobilis subsp. mobilis str. CP4 = NRRL B-14023]